MMSSCLGRAAVPVKRVWRGLLSPRLGRRQSRTTTYVPVNPEHDGDYDDDHVGVTVGLGRLRKDVRTCEYHDVHVMWAMLSGGGTGRGGGGVGKGRDDDDDDDVEAAAAAGKAKTSGRAGRGRKQKQLAPAWRRVVAYCYCCAF